MGTVQNHYAELLAPIYLWMAGGAEAAISQGNAELSALRIPSSPHSRAIDLGAGFGMHAIPLAHLGYHVTAIDTSPVLLAQLRQLSEGLTIRTIEADLLGFSQYLDAAPSLILCMTDTLTHLPTMRNVGELCSQVASALAPGGRFVATFRDYTRPARNDARFILVRSDSDRVHTCFLEEEHEHMLVHDIVHERNGDTWTMRVSHYPKLRLEPEAVVDHLKRYGLSVSRGPGPRGMVQIVATRS